MVWYCSTCRGAHPDGEVCPRVLTRESLEEENYLLRYLLWNEHPCEGKYGDDGEMQCGACGIDFKRDNADTIQTKLFQTRLLKYAVGQKIVVVDTGARKTIELLKKLKADPHSAFEVSRPDLLPLLVAKDLLNKAEKKETRHEKD